MTYAPNARFGLHSSLLLVASLIALACSACSSPEPNSCKYAYDGVCDEPQHCDAGTDTTDCGDNSCKAALDGECDEPRYCEVGTDRDDCVAAHQPCTPDCSGRTCGPDPVCGSSCGACAAPTSCDDSSGQCSGSCVPSCGARECGIEPTCGSSCGTCATGSCNAAGQCETVDDCAADCQALRYTSCSCRSDDPCGWIGDGACDSNCIQVSPNNYFDDSLDCGCTPNCGGRQCGPDPVCGVSCGACAAGTCDASGTCVLVGGAPQFTLFNADRTTLRPTDSVVFTGIVSDPDGAQDVVGVELRDDVGTLYGTFGVGGSTYSILITWEQINAIRPITMPDEGGSSRLFLAVARDSAGNTATADYLLQFDCWGATEAACSDGTCVDLSYSTDHCGTCNNAVPPPYGFCDEGVPSCSDPYTTMLLCDGECIDVEWNIDNCGACGRSCTALATQMGANESDCNDGRCEITFNLWTTRQTCDSLCQPQGLTCSGWDPTSWDPGAYYVYPGAEDLWLGLSCDEVPPALHPEYSLMEFGRMYCLCRG